MTATSPRSVVPSDGQRGLASWEPADLAALVLPSWDAFLEIARAVDLDGPTRVRGWTARELCIHLGSWPGSRSLQRLTDEARSDPADGRHESSFDQDSHNDAVIEAHAGASRDDVLTALTEARTETASFLSSTVPDELGGRLVRSVLGPLPLLTMVCAATYELAVHALDLAPAGAAAPPDHLLSAGLASLVDVTAALAARCEITTIAGCVSPQGGWAFATEGADWLTMDLPAVPTGWPVVDGEAAVLLDASAGRRGVPMLLARREMRLHHVGGLLALAPIVEAVPGLPGAHALGGAARHLRGAGRLLRRLPGI
ncbi:MAG: maleylpyruvate isomerase N-terminal domain-containing protein [Actinomycetes bacterium]